MEEFFFFFFTFLCVLQPLNKLFHLLQEHALPLGEVGFGVPLQYGLFTQNVRWEERRGGVSAAQDQRLRHVQQSLNFFACAIHPELMLGGRLLLLFNDLKFGDDQSEAAAGYENVRKRHQALEVQ